MRKEITLADGSVGEVKESGIARTFFSHPYKYIFYKKNGNMIRWGEKITDDPDPLLGLPEIADIEVSTVCTQGCKFCYKDNTKKGKNMSFRTFKKILDKILESCPTLTQIAFGVGDFERNKDILRILNYAHEKGLAANITVKDVDVCDMYELEKLKRNCNAVAISFTDMPTIEMAVSFMQSQPKQLTIHVVLAEQNFDDCMSLLKTKADQKNNEWIAPIKAILFLSLKQKGRAIENGYNRLDDAKFEELVKFACLNDVPLGFDSCTAQRYLSTLQKLSKENQEIADKVNMEMVQDMIEPCESSLFSMYVNVEGKYFPCSFIEGTPGWEEGLDIAGCDNFLKDVWWAEKTKEFRDKVINCRNCKTSCPVYAI